jgi:hypothetical protein
MKLLLGLHFFVLFSILLQAKEIYIVDYETPSDFKVFKVMYSSQVGKNDGCWFFVDYSSQADKKIFFVKYESQADLKIYFG